MSDPVTRLNAALQGGVLLLSYCSSVLLTPTPEEVAL